MLIHKDIWIFFNLEKRMRIKMLRSLTSIICKINDNKIKTNPPKPRLFYAVLVNWRVFISFT